RFLRLCRDSESELLQSSVRPPPATEYAVESGRIESTRCRLSAPRFVPHRLRRICLAVRRLSRCPGRTQHPAYERSSRPSDRSRRQLLLATDLALTELHKPLRESLAIALQNRNSS